MAPATCWMERGIKYAFTFLLIVLTTDYGNAQNGYFPLYTDYSRIEDNDFRSHRFPASNGVPGGSCGSSRDARNLAGPMQFMTFSNKSSILIGGAEALYLLDEDTLRCQNIYEEPSNQTLVDQCRNAMDDHTGCLNFLSVYGRFPSNDVNENRILVCATHAGVYQDCLTVKIQDRMFNLSTQTAKVSAPYGLVSFFPQLGGFGEFRELDGNVSDATYFSAGFYKLPDVSRDIGRNYNITFQTVTFDEATSQLTLQRRLSIKDDPHWWNFPVEFTQYFKVSYPRQTGLPDGYTLDFYFVFLREGVLGSQSNIKQSRVMRICQNDPGVGDVFSTMLKTRIYCQREAPQDLAYVGSVDYRYNEINAVDLTAPEGGRYMERTQWSDYMYAAFSGPQLGPPGTAICVYHNDVIDNPTQYNQGLYSVFLEDVTRAPGLSPSMIQNEYFACRPGGRPAEYINDVTIDINLAQVGEDPLIVLDGILVVKMLVDQACIVRNDNPRICLNQDVFFVGTDLGRIIKMVLASVGTRNYETVVAEDFLIDGGSHVTDMSFRTVNDVKNLFIATNTSLHSFPLERCSRLQGCRECIAARDPYCVWNNNTGHCETSLSNNLSVVGSDEMNVPEYLWQNIHTGIYRDCEVAQECTIQAVAVNDTTIRCIAGCNGTSSINITTNSPIKSSSSCTDSFGSDSNVSGCMELMLDNGLGLHTYSCVVQSQYTTDVTTRRGPPAEFESDLYSSCGQTSCRFCVQELDLTDDIGSYTIQVEYSRFIGLDMYTPLQPFQEANGCVSLTGLTPGSLLLNTRVIIHNSAGRKSSNRNNVSLLDGEAGPVQNLSVMDVTSNAIDVTWEVPAVLNGTLLGYSVRVNGAVALICESRIKATNYTCSNVLPYTNYTIEVQACNKYGESSQSMRINRQTACGIPSAVTDVNVTKTITSLRFSWNAPQHFNGDISQELYQVAVDCFKVGQNGSTNTAKVSSRSLLVEEYISLANSPRSLCCANISAITTCNGNTMVGAPHVLCGTTVDAIPGAVINLKANSGSIGVNSFVVSWQHPTNYDSLGLNYRVVLSDHQDHYIAEQFFFAGDLQPCTDYLVTVTAINTLSVPGEARAISIMTAPALPPSPINLVFSYDGSSDILSLSWDAFNMSCSTQSIMYYKVIWSCDGFRSQTNQNTNSTSVILSQNVDFGLCIATAQSCDTFDRCSPFSDQVVVEATVQRPPTLVCYSYVELNNDVKAAFLFPSPFITSGLRIQWNLINLNTNMSEISNYSYNASSTSVADLPTESNTQYIFSIYACNIYGCGNPCNLNFSTSAIPSPPEKLNVTNIETTTAMLTWTHINTRPTVTYAISITSSCPTAVPFYIDNIQGTSYTFANLCPNDGYTVAVLAEDKQVHQRSIYSTHVQFRTNSGIPSAPRFIVLTIDPDSKVLRITWHTPKYLNAEINGYVVKLTENSCNSVSKYEEPVNNVVMYEFSNFQGDINLITACVRAKSINGTLGQWGTSDKLRVQSLTTSSTGRDCNTLIIVVCFAAAAIVLSVIMLISLLYSIYQYKNSTSGDQNK